MKLDDMSSGAIYVDTNVFYMYLRSDPAYLDTIKTFWYRVARGEIQAFSSPLAFDELFYRLLLARIKDTTQNHPLDLLRNNPKKAIATHHRPIREAIQNFTHLPHLAIVAVQPTDLEQMMDNIGQFSILPRDALHLAIMQRLRLSTIASDDLDFDRVGDIERNWITQPKQ